MPLSKPSSMEEYLERNNENMYSEDAPRPVAQASASYTMPLRTLFDAGDDDKLMNDEERRFFTRRYQIFVDNANNYITNECPTQAEINEFFIRRLARQDATIDWMERKVQKTLRDAVEAEIDLFLGSKPTTERIRGVNRRLNQMQLELKTFKDEIKSHPEFSGNPEDVKAKKAAMAAAAGVANQSKKRKKAPGTAVPVGDGAGQGPDGLDLLYESMLEMASRLRKLREPEPTPTAPTNNNHTPILTPRSQSTDETTKEDDAKMRLDGGTDSDMADDEVSSQLAPSSPHGVTSLTHQLSTTDLWEEEEQHAARTQALFSSLPVRCIPRNGGGGGGYGEGRVNY